MIAHDIVNRIHTERYTGLPDDKITQNSTAARNPPSQVSLLSTSIADHTWGLMSWKNLIRIHGYQFTSTIFTWHGCYYHSLEKSIS